jgi:hypothetical protein
MEANEQIIEHGLQTFYEVGGALATIRDDRLYRSTHDTFEDYCRERWGMSRRYANLLIVSSDVVANLGTMVPMLPTSERQVRPLSVLEPEQQREAWQRSVETAPTGKPTAAHVERVVEEMKRPAPIEPDRIIPAPIPDRLAVHKSSDSVEWYTPSHIIDLVIGFFDEIDLDPCSNSHENPNVPASRVFTKADNGLTQPWFGRVYMNPPYGDEISAWVKKLHEEYQNGDIEAAIALLPARIDTAWFEYVLPYAICRIRGRLRFVGADNSAPFPSVLVYYGDEVRRFQEATAALGQVLTVYGHTPGDRLLDAPDDDTDIIDSLRRSYPNE